MYRTGSSLRSVELSVAYSAGERSTYLGNGLAVETYHNASKLFVPMLNVEVDFMSDLGTCINVSVPSVAHACFIGVCLPLAASELWAKKAKVMVRISSADTTLR